MSARATKPNGKRHLEAAEADQLPPHDEGAEAALLGCILLDNGTVCGEWIASVDSRLFYLLQHRTLFEELAAMHAGRETIDMVTVLARLKAKGLLADCGGAAYVNGLPEKAPCASAWEEYLAILRDRYQRRRVLTMAINLK